MKCLWLAALLSFFCFTLCAQPVSVDDARLRAAKFFASERTDNVGTKTRAAASDLTLAYTAESDSVSCLYVFNKGNEDGFVAIGGDEVATEVLVHSDHGSFCYDDANANLKYWLSCCCRQIAAARRDAARVETEEPLKAKRAARSDVDILVSSCWGQKKPYNNAVRNYAKKDFNTGCVATAMSQVMKAHEWPVTGSGSYSYYDTFSKKSYFRDFSEHTYRWSDMLDVYSDSSTTEQEDAVAELMFDVGVAVCMQYGTTTQGGSGAFTEYVPYALVTYFGYDEGVGHAYRDYYSDDEWAEMVYGELSAGRCVMYGGFNGSSGHSFICDGYRAKDNTYHFNWGWDGIDDCYCALSAVKGSGYNWKYYQDMVYGIQKPCGGKTRTNIILYDSCYLESTKMVDDSLATYFLTFGEYAEEDNKECGFIWNDTWKEADVLFTMKYKNCATGEEFYAVPTDPESNRRQLGIVYGNGTYPAIDTLEVRSVKVPVMPAGSYRLSLVYKDWADLENGCDSLWQEVRSFTTAKNYVTEVVENKEVRVDDVFAAENQSEVSVFDLSGVLLYEGRWDDVMKKLPVSAARGQVVIVRTGSSSVRYLVK